MIINGIIFLGLVALAGVGTELYRLYRTYTHRVKQRDLHTWRERQQSKWKIRHPSFQFEQTSKWDGDIPVLVKKEKK